MLRPTLFLLIILILTGCEKFKTRKLATVQFNFQTELNQSDFDLMNQFEDSENRSISLELIKFYLSDFSLITEDGETVITEEILLIELDNNGKASFSVKVDPGNYTGISFGIGVPQAMNEAGPDSFNESGHPLNALNNTYWGMNGMYRFVMIDGRYFENGNYVNTFSYHTGYDESFRNLQLDKSMTFKKKENYEETLYIDVSKILEGPGGNLDIVNEPNFHGELDDIHLSKTLSDNFKSAFRF